jgi:hypothetical protein
MSVVKLGFIAAIALLTSHVTAHLDGESQASAVLSNARISRRILQNPSGEGTLLRVTVCRTVTKAVQQERVS